MFLFLNTANKSSSISLFDENLHLVAKKDWEAQFSQSETLLQEIDNILESANIKILNLKKIIVNVGPGSYTGIRVGVTTANLLSFGLGIPVIGIRNDNLVNIFEIILENEDQIFIAPVLPIYLNEPFITKPKPRL